MSGSLLKSTAVVAVMTFLSRIFGFVRDLLMARLLGASPAMDAFLVAFKIPNFMRRLFAEGSFSQAFVPVLAEYKSTREFADVRRMTQEVAGALSAALALITVIGVLAAPVLISIFAPGFLDNAQQFDRSVVLLRITFPYLLFISLTALAGSILNTYQKFAIPAVTPVLLNISLIAVLVWWVPSVAEPVTALAWGVFCAGVVQLLFQLPFLAQIKLLPRPRLVRDSEPVKKVFRLMLPTLFGSSVAQINLLFDTLIASFLAAGSVSWLYYADRLMEFPLGVFGIAMATVVLPSLSQKHAEKSPADFSQTLDWALRLVLFIGLPAALGLLILSGPILITLFYSDAFSLIDVAMSKMALMAYSVGVVGFILVKVLVTGFYSRQDTRTPVKIGLWAILCNMVSNVFLVSILVWIGYQAPHAGLALSTSLAAFLNAGLLFRHLRRARIYQPVSGWPKALMRAVAAALIMSIVLVWLIPNQDKWLSEDHFWRISHLLTYLSAGTVVYFSSLWLFGVRTSDFRSSVTSAQESV